jgi:hypothetical protein
MAETAFEVLNEVTKNIEKKLLMWVWECENMRMWGWENVRMCELKSSTSDSAKICVICGKIVWLWELKNK